MKKNMGIADRIIRLVIVAVLATLYFTGTAAGTIGTIFIIAAVFFTLTSIIGFCPIYAIFGISSCTLKKPQTS